MLDFLLAIQNPPAVKAKHLPVGLLPNAVKDIYELVPSLRVDLYEVLRINMLFYYYLIFVQPLPLIIMGKFLIFFVKYFIFLLKLLDLIFQS